MHTLSNSKSFVSRRTFTGVSGLVASLALGAVSLIGGSAQADPGDITYKCDAAPQKAYVLCGVQPIKQGSKKDFNVVGYLSYDKLNPSKSRFDIIRKITLPKGRYFSGQVPFKTEVVVHTSANPNAQQIDG